MLYAADLVWKALAPVLPNRLTAGHMLSVCGYVLAGRRPDTGENIIICEPSTGGWGAGQGKDGENAQFCVADGETFNIPIEVTEARYGVRMTEYSLRTDGAGAGEYRGGCGAVRGYKVLGDEHYFTGTFGRHKFLPWGLCGGGDGSRNEFPSISDDVEAIYLPTDNTFASAMANVAKVTEAKKLPVIAGAQSMVEEGGLATIGLDYYKLGLQTGAMAAKILNNENEPATTPVETLQDTDLMINFDTAKAIGYTFPPEILAEATIRIGKE